MITGYTVIMMNTKLDVMRAVGTLDRAGPLPLYFQLRQAVLREIREGGLAPGDRLPTEAEMERRYGVSRSTIRQALNDLAAEGLIHRIQGKGTFVGSPKIQHVPVLTSFSELLRAQGYQPSHRLLDSSVLPGPPEVAEGLQVEEGTSCRFLRRLFLADDDPVGLAETWLPRAALGPNDELFENGEIEHGSLYELLQSEAIGLALHRAVEPINPGVAEAAAARRRGELAVAAEDALTWAGRFNAGDLFGFVDYAGVLGVRRGATADGVLSAGMDVLERMLAGGGELVTVLLGADAPAGVDDALDARLREAHPEIEFAAYPGGQAGSVLTFGVE
jgi:GntR family transcriptional regulator